MGKKPISFDGDEWGSEAGDSLRAISERLGSIAREREDALKPLVEQSDRLIEAMFGRDDDRIDMSEWAIHVDDSPMRTASAVEEMVTHTQSLLELTRVSVEMARQSKEDSSKVERFTRRMTWASLAIAIASLAASIAAIWSTI